jgi:hypothetical protein
MMMTTKMAGQHNGGSDELFLARGEDDKSLQWVIA